MSNRYYDSCGAEGEIKPGRISAELREALNIAENDIPLWIYRMRALGYPPGWLKKAVVDTNDIFDTDPPSPNQSGSSNKRKNQDQDEVEVQYDHSKLIEYPGFNAPMPKGCVDYHYYINMPAMLEHQQLEYAKKHMNAFKPVQIPKRAKLSSSPNSSNNESTTIPPLGDDPASPDDDDAGGTDNDCNDDSLATNTTTTTSETNKNEKNLNKSTISLPEEIKLVSKGSPMPKPVQRASLEKFSEGVVGELLYFENLPASTGKFESIRGLLNTMKKSKSEKDLSFSSTKST